MGIFSKMFAANRDETIGELKVANKVNQEAINAQQTALKVADKVDTMPPADADKLCADLNKRPN